MSLTAILSGHGLAQRRMLSGHQGEKSQYPIQRRDPLTVIASVARKLNPPQQPSSPSQQRPQHKMGPLHPQENQFHDGSSPPTLQQRRERNHSSPDASTPTTFYSSKNITREPLTVPRNQHGSISHGASDLPSTLATGPAVVTSAQSTLTVSTSTASYSGVKLAPPVKSASVEGVERRTSDQKIWYTIQVYPSCDGVGGGGVRRRASTTHRTTRAAADTAMNMPQKPYKIYRLYEDVADFASQLEEELPRLLKSAKMVALAQASSSSWRSPRESTVISPPSPVSNHAYGVHDTSIASGSSALKDNGSSTISVRTPRTSKSGNTSANVNAQATRMDAGGAVAGASTCQPMTLSEISLPRLKSNGLVLFATRAVYLQRKDELDRYLQELFSGNALGHGLLGPIIAHSRLVAEFFGIWKTDVEAHLRHEDYPLALHSIAIPPPAALAPGPPANESAVSTMVASATTISLQSESNKDQIKEEDEEEDEEEEQRAALLANNRHRLPRPSLHTLHIHPAIANSFPSSHPCSDPNAEISASSFPAVPTSIPSPAFSTHSHNSSTPTSIESPRNQHQNTDPTMTFPYNASSSLAPVSPRHLKSSPRSSGWTQESMTQHAGSIFQPQQQYYQRSIHPLDMDPDMASPTDVFAVNPVSVPISKPKRSKTIVFRPEVAMHPFSSKGVNPSWNGIPAVTGINTSNLGISTGSPFSPPSPNSPGTPRRGSNASIADSGAAMTPTTRDPEERSRKLTMSQSKTMPAISSQSPWGDSSSRSSSISSPALANTGNNNSNMFGRCPNARSMSVSSSSTPLVAPWNRAYPNTETTTHLDSLFKIKGGSSGFSSSHQPSPLSPNLNSSYIPMEPEKSFFKKEGLPKSHTIATSLSSLAQYPETLNRSGRSGMTHSVSAPGGFLPSTSCTLEAAQTMSKTSTLLNKRCGPRRGSAPTLPMSSKQPVGILKNSIRKGSLTVPVVSMFPALPPSPTTPTTAIGHRHGTSLATTFKIVISSDTIVALQVFEDKGSVLTLKELRRRVKIKLLKSNIQLPEIFDLIWIVPTSGNSSGSNTPMATPPTPCSPGPAPSIFSQSEACMLLKTEEDLQRAIHSSKNKKVVLRCTI